MKVGSRRRTIAALVVLGSTVAGTGGGVSAQEAVDKGPSEAEVTAPERAQPRIVGGTVAPTGAYPWHVALDFGLGPSQCGGSLVSSRWVMTAAHCVDGLTPNRLTLIVGRSALSDTSQGEVRGAAQILVHPSYDDFTSEFDAALVRLDTPATRRWARPALPGDPFSPGDSLRAIGHGNICEDCSRSDQLRQVDLPVQSDSTMQDLYGSDFDPATMLGAGPIEGGRDTCQGDSGGPLFVPGDLQPAVAGITSWGFGCARPDNPGVYSEVASAGIRSFVAGTVPRPANDDLASAQALSGPSGQVSGANTDATGQVGEPDHAASAADTTVWYSWTAPSTAPVSFAVATGSFDSALAVYTGTAVDGLAVVAANDDSEPDVDLDPRVIFTPAAGVTYRIAVDGVTASWGSFQLQWGPPPATGPGGALSDFTGDGRADPAVYRPAASQWFVNGGTPSFAAWGTQGDIPVPADYTGDGRADVAVFRPSTGTWFVQGASPGAVVWGAQGDVPVPADYTGDGRADVAVFRPSTGTWFVQGASPASVAWGTQGDIPVPADYTGDGRADVAVFRPSSGTWFVQGASPAFTVWGTQGDIPVPADYTGDGRADVAVFRPSSGTWFVQGAAPGFLAWGTQGDVPVVLPAALYERFF